MAETLERNKRKREEDEAVMWGDCAAAQAMAVQEEQKEKTADAGPSDAPPSSAPPSPPDEEAPEKKNIFGGPLHPPIFEEWEGPEPSGCLAAGWGRPICQSPKPTKKVPKSDAKSNEFSDSDEPTDRKITSTTIEDVRHYLETSKAKADNDMVV